MKRTALLGLLALGAGCNLPLVMVEVEVPDACVTRIVDVKPTNVVTGVSGTNELPADMATKLSTDLGTTITLNNNLIDLPAKAKDLLDLDVQLKLVRVEALAPNPTALDQVRSLSFTVNPPAGSGLAPKTILAMTSVPAPSDPLAASGTPVEASGQQLNLADYLYAGQLTFTYAIDATIVVPTAWQARVTTCVATRGYAAASVNDIKGL